MAAKKKVEQAPLRAGLPFPVNLKKLHPLVRATMGAIQRREWGGTRFKIDVSEPLIERAIQIFEAIVRGCESHGISVEVSRTFREGERYPIFKLGRGEIEVRLREPSTQHFEQGTYGRTRIYTPTGFLVFSLESWGLYEFSGRKKWQEGPDKALEGWVVEIVDNIAAAANYLSQEEDRRDEREPLREAMKEMEDFHKSAKDVQEKALSRVLADARNVSIARELRGYISEIEKRVAEGVETTEAEAWLAWARFVAAEVDPLSPGREPWQEPAFRRLMLDLVPPAPI